MNENEKFRIMVENNIDNISKDSNFIDLSKKWMNESVRNKYSYNFKWMGRPIIQYPQDIVAMQEIIFDVKPDLIIETGIAHGGGLMLYASMLELLGENGQVIGLEQHIFPEFREEIEKSPLMKRIIMLEGNSVSDEIVKKVYDLAKGKKRVMLALDSCHTHEHVLNELNCFSSLVKIGSYIVVFDTMVEDVDDIFNLDRPWSVNNNPKTAVREFLSKNNRFEIDKQMSDKLQISVCPDGYLKCIL